jgi:hypothetical protein
VQHPIKPAHSPKHYSLDVSRVAVKSVSYTRAENWHMPIIEVGFKLEKETKGALRYQEVDEKGEVIEQPWAKIGTLYVRKSAFERGAAFPQLLRPNEPHWWVISTPPLPYDGEK